MMNEELSRKQRLWNSSLYTIVLIAGYAIGFWAGRHRLMPQSWLLLLLVVLLGGSFLSVWSRARKKPRVENLTRIATSLVCGMFIGNNYGRNGWHLGLAPALIVGLPAAFILLYALWRVWKNRGKPKPAPMEPKVWLRRIMRNLLIVPVTVVLGIVTAGFYNRAAQPNPATWLWLLIMVGPTMLFIVLSFLWDMNKAHL